MENYLEEQVVCQRQGRNFTNADFGINSYCTNGLICMVICTDIKHIKIGLIKSDGHF